MLAELANPEWVSVPLVGWRHMEALSKICDVHLVTHERNRECIERSGFPMRQVTIVSLGWLDRVLYAVERWFFKRIALATLSAVKIPFYCYFEWLVWRLFAERLRRGEFDVVHRITPVSPVQPSPMSWWCAGIGIPFVLGPINGGLPWPEGYTIAMAKESEWLSNVRRFFPLIPGLKRTWRAAAAIVVASRNTEAQIPHSFSGKVHYLPENAVPASQVVDVEKIEIRLRDLARRPMRIVFLGRLVPYKCADLVIHAALDLLRSGSATLEIIGDGPERGALEELAIREGVTSQVRFFGWMQNAAAMKQLAKSDVFAFPSIREFGGGVVLEAMSLGLVPIVVNYGGPGEIVTSDIGVAIPPKGAEDTVVQLKAALQRLSSDPEKLRELALAARECVLKRWTWDAKAKSSIEIYFGVRAPDPEVKT